MSWAPGTGGRQQYLGRTDDDRAGHGSWDYKSVGGKVVAGRGEYHVKSRGWITPGSAGWQPLTDDVLFSLETVQPKQIKAYRVWVKEILKNGYDHKLQRAGGRGRNPAK